jgi:lipase chaperone LimK
VRLPLPGVDTVEARSERVARYGEAAAARLEEVDAKWAEWERRLASARTQWQRVQTAEHLSAPQKKAEMDRYVDAHFHGKEQLRVRALLQLP